MSDIPKKNKLATVLEAGEDIKGLLGYVETGLQSSEELPILVKIRCVKVEAGSNGKSCGVRVVATPVSGSGEFYCDPCQWYDTPAQFDKAREYQNRVSAADKAKKEITGHRLITCQKSMVLELASQLGKEKELRTECEEKFKLQEDGTQYNRLLVKAEATDVNNLAIWLCAEKYGINPTDMYTRY